MNSSKASNESSSERSVVVLGASSNPARYSNMALERLKEQGYVVIPVNPGHDTIGGVPAKRSLSDITVPVDTVTVYVNPELLRKVLPQIVALAPRRVILNPGTEDRQAHDALTEAGIETVEACTLVLLGTGAF